MAEWKSARMVRERRWVRVTVGPHSFSARDIWWLSVGPCSGCEQQPETVSSVPAWFRADLGTNLIKQGENVTVDIWLDSSMA